MHTQRHFCARIKRYEGDYLLIAKGNQPSMREDLELFFEDEQADRSCWQTATSLDKGHGRMEKRIVTSRVEVRDWFAQLWSGIEQVFRIERLVSKKGRTSREVVYGITSLTPQQANVHRIAALVRAYWAIENRGALAPRCHPV